MKKLKINLFLVLVIISFIQVDFIESVCTVRYPDDIEISPIFAKVLGKYTVYLPYNGKDLILSDGETIQGYCRTSFSSISYSKQNMDYEYYRYRGHSDNVVVSYDESSISLNCVGDTLHFKNSILKQSVLTCNKLNWTVYDANESYEWCEKNQNSKTFLLAAKSNGDHHILAGVCFNLNEWCLQTITYNITGSDHKYNKEFQRDITKTHLKGFQSLGDELSNLKTNYFDFTEKDLQQQLEELRKTNFWLNLANYELSSIVQGESYENYFSEFVNTLSIVWWRNLRLGNWKVFMTKLENYAHKNSFQIYTGTSGVVRVPSKNPADNILEIKNGFLNRTVPGYIWTYLTSTDNQNKDFIVVGYNSPFAEWFGINEIIFCPDICSQIPWLKEVTTSFRYATAGVMFCCSTDFVRQTNFLHGFPMDVLLARSIQNQTDVPKIEHVSENTVNVTHTDTTEQSHTVADDVEGSTENLLDI